MTAAPVDRAGGATTAEVAGQLLVPVCYQEA